ncbi:MAG: toxic anion resistance protein [Clostridiales bacterium]|jgi:uncharacterized protein YaaN involved in tellurite resistance|nr:toxic anion resistance protein [Clostridiales bacterium]
MPDLNYEYTPNLTLSPENAPEVPVTQKTELTVSSETKETAPLPELTMDSLSEDERLAIREFAKKIDITDTNMVMQYGSSAQKNISDFSGAALENVRTKDMGQVGSMLGNLVVQLKGLDFDVEEKKGILGLFKRATNKIETLKIQYDKAETNVDKITQSLEGHQLVLLKDMAMLDKMYDLNLAYFKELSMYILAGKEKLREITEKELPVLKEKAQKSGLPEDAQAASDFANMINRFDKKIHDLELTRIISIQMAPQIRLIQNNDAMMVEKIQTSIVNTIPLWKSQMVLALGIAHSQQAMEAQREVTDLTNDLLKKNAEMLKSGSIEVARESERGIVDLETLKFTNQNLIETLEEVRTIQSEGYQKRREAEAELGRIEGELKKKLLELKD